MGPDHPPLRVLLIDASPQARLAVSGALRRSGVDIVGTATDIDAGTGMVAALRPDITLVAASAGTLDWVPPRGRFLRFVAHSEGDMANSLLRPRDADLRVWAHTRLLPRIQALCGLSVPEPHAPAPPPAPRLPPRMLVEPRVLAIAASTGGPEALTLVLRGLPRGFPLPVLIVQHMPAAFTPVFAASLSAVCAIPVREAIDGEPVLAGRAYLAPGGFHMEVAASAELTRIRVHQGPQENYCRPAADPLFRSVQAVYGAHALAVVLTGMGQDGLLGARGLREVGAQVLAQDEATSVVWGMPGFIAKEGLADAVLPLKEVCGEILKRVSGKVE